MLLRRVFLCSLLLWASPAALLCNAAAATPEQVSTFFRAVTMDDARTVQSMLGQVDPNDGNPIGGEPALVLAVREGAMDVFKTLLAHPGIRVDAAAINGNTALMMAAFKGNRPAAEALLARGAAVDGPGWTPLHYAAAAGENGIAGLLLQRGARIDAVSPRASGSFTPLMMAAREGKEDSARFLAEHGANRRLRNGEGLTAAGIAARAEHAALAKALAP